MFIGRESPISVVSMFTESLRMLRADGREMAGNGPEAAEPR